MSSEAAASIIQWIVAQPSDADDAGAFAREFARRMLDAGVPLWRFRYALMTMHPEVLWRSVLWSARDGVSVFVWGVILFFNGCALSHPA